jgi:glucose/mannose-6-phosphate isomerase
MDRVIERLPDQIEISLDMDLPALPNGPFKKVCINGLGGSALPVDVVLDAFRNKLKSSVQLTRNYKYPTQYNESDLFIASSFSGNTEEVLASISSFPENIKNIVVLSGGGDLSKLAEQRKYPLVRIPVEKENKISKNFQPRCAIGYFVTLFSRILFETGNMVDPIHELKSVPPFLRSVSIKSEAQKIAIWLKGKIPVFYTDEPHLLSVGRIAKIKINENSKRPAFFNALPEANHNEMIGFVKSIEKFGLLYIHDPESEPQIGIRFDTMKRVLENEGLDNLGFKKWEMPGENNIQRIFASLMFADWISYFLAFLYEQDPTPVDLVESFKNELS